MYRCFWLPSSWGRTHFLHSPHLPPPSWQPDHYDDKGYTPRIPGERLSASYINHYKCNGGAVISKVRPGRMRCRAGCSGLRLAALPVMGASSGCLPFWPAPPTPRQFGAGAAAADQRALDILGEAYCKYLDSNTRVVAVDSREVLLNAGNVHCITQQQPAEVSVRARIAVDARVGRD